MYITYLTTAATPLLFCLHILQGLGVKLLLTGSGTKVEGLIHILRGCRGCFLTNLHPAYRVFCFVKHFLSPLFFVGFKPQSVGTGHTAALNHSQEMGGEVVLLSSHLGLACYSA